MSANICPMQQQRRVTPNSEDGREINQESASGNRSKTENEGDKLAGKDTPEKGSEKEQGGKNDKQKRSGEKNKSKIQTSSSDDQHQCAKGGPTKKKQSPSSGSNKNGGAGGETKQTCEKCQNDFSELHYCVHCASSVCTKCRCKHIEKQVEEFGKVREEATSNQRSVNKKIQKLAAMLEELQREEDQNSRAIDSDFKEIEKILLNRKNALKKDMKQKYALQTKPLQDQKRTLERDFTTINAKFEGILRNISLPPSNASLSAYGKIKNPDFAQLCGFTVKCGECNASFGELKGRAAEVTNNVKMIEYDYKTGSEEMVTELKNHGEVKFREKKDEETEDGKEASKSGDDIGGKVTPGNEEDRYEDDLVENDDGLTSPEGRTREGTAISEE